jgi:hypothetical protein
MLTAMQSMTIRTERLFDEIDLPLAVRIEDVCKPGLSPGETGG